MGIVLHAFPHSPRGFKVLAAAAHLGVDHTFRFCDLVAGDQRRPEFAALNPNQKMPVLEDGDLKLWESNAILLHLAALKPEAALAPRDELARADMLRWMFWESTTWDPPVATLAFERVVKQVLGLGAADPAAEAKGEAAFTAAATILDAHLATRPFVCGPQLTLADFALGSSLIVADAARLPLAPFAALRRWGDHMAALPAWQAALALQAAPAAATAA